MEFISTRGGAAASAGSAILQGMAKDGGLFVPSSFPIITKEQMDEMLDWDYPRRAAFILKRFLSDYTEEELSEYCAAAYAKFDGDPAPVLKMDEATFLMELFHGPTRAFKDIALTLLPYLIRGARKKAGSDHKTLILVATSGDTGKAALEGFKDVEGTEIIVFYPSEGVSDMQKLQMQTSEGSNVHVVGIEGNFDDAQTAVKSIFKDPEAIRRLDKMGYAFSSANSINWGRLCPQIVYYFSAYLDLVAAGETLLGEPVNFVVPTGNFGNILAGYYARRMGLPIAKLIVASNRNNVLTDFFTTGNYDVNRAFHKTMSPSMDILISSNLERLLFEIGGRDPEYVKSAMRDLEVYGSYTLDFDRMQAEIPEFVAYCSSEEETADAIDNFFDMFDYTLDPHTAVAVSAYYNYLTDTEDETETVILATASPFKFSSDVLRSLTRKEEKDPFRAAKKLASYTMEEIPEQIAALESLPVRHKLVIPKGVIKETVFDLLASDKG